MIEFVIIVLVLGLIFGGKDYDEDFNRISRSLSDIDSKLDRMNLRLELIEDEFEGRSVSKFDRTFGNQSGVDDDV